MKTTIPTSTRIIVSKTAVILVALCLGAQTYGGFNQFSIGLNLGSDNTANGTGARALNPTDVAGLPAVSQANWNNLPGVSGSLAAPTDNNGNATAANVVWTSPTGTYSSGGNNGFVSVNDHTLMMGYLDNGGTATVTLTGLPTQLTTSGYDVYVYANYDTPARGGTYSIVDGITTSTVLRAPVPLLSDATPTNYVQSPGLVSSYTGNYLVFRGLTNANIQLVAVATNTGTPRAIICGVQLVASPAPGEAGAASGLKMTTNGFSGQLALSWTNGASSQGAMVVMRKGLPVTAKPVDGVTYNANSTIGLGDNLADDEFGAPNYVVFNGPTSGTTNSFTVSGLTPTATYYAAVYSSIGTGASADFSLANPATGSAVATGAATNITLVAPATVIIGNGKRYSVLAQYDNGTTADITGTASVTSSNASIVSITGAGRLGAINTGTVGIKAISGGFTNIQLVTVLPLSMTYQFSFNEPSDSLTVTDSVAGAVGTIFNTPFTATDGNGRIIFDGGGGYVGLPANIISSYGGITVEFWATLSAVGTWARFFDFGTGQTVNMFMTPAAGGGFLRTAFTVGGSGAETQVNDPFTPDVDNQHQYVFTLAGSTRTAKLFLDGAQVGINTNFLLTPEDVGPTPNNYIGKSQYADPYLNGNMAEFRIYNGPLDGFSIALDAATGPDVITNNPGAIQSLSVTAGSPVVQFGFEQVTVSGTFANVANPVNLTTAPQTTYLSSDLNVATINASGLLTATGPGTVKISALAFGMSNGVFVTVTPLPPGMTHRWPFNTDFNDTFNPAVPAVPHGTVSLDGLGNAVLDGSGAAGGPSGAYVELPANILLGYSSIALECWYTDQAGDGTGINRNWSRLWDFGSGPGNNLFLTPFVAGEVDTMRLALNLNNAGEWQVHCVRPLPTVEHHIVFVIDSTNHTAYLYVDGLLAGQNRDFQVRPRDLGLNPQDWLGRSQYGDPLFAGLIDEFRIYNGTLDPVQIGIDFVTGPNNLVTNPGALNAVSIGLTANMVAGNRQPAQAYATFASVANAPVTGASSNWTSSDSTVARVDKYGRVTAVGPGSASISATFNGMTGSAGVTVTAATLPVLMHRYSFDAGDVTDSVGGANGSVGAGSPVFSGGMVGINDTASWVALPGHLFDTNLEVTIETWCVVSNNNGSGARMLDFGNSSAGRDAFGIAPTANGNNFVAFRQSPNDAIGTPSVNTYGRPAFGTTNHYAYAISDINRRIDIYVNGKLADSFPYETQPDQLMGGNVQFRTVMGYHQNNMIEGWIGKNVGGAAGSGFFGAVDELRIWSGAMNKLQAQVSFQKGQGTPQVDPGAFQSLSVAMSDTTMVLGALQHPSVSGTFASTTGSLDLTGLPGLMFFTSDASKVAIVNGGDAKLQAVGIGSANIIVSYGGKSVTNAVTVIAKPQAIATHRFTFRSGTAGPLSDSIGHGSAALFGNATIAGGKLVLDGSANPPSYARLPNDLISGYDLATIEAFYSASAGSSGTQQRLWDFGDHVVTAGGITGAGYLYEAAGRGAVGMPNAVPGAGETSAIAPSSNRSAFTTNTVHVVATIDSINHILSIYTNGVFSISATNPVVDLSLVVDNFSNLGRSQWADPAFNGSIDDFRVYYGMLTPSQIAASYAGGPDPEHVTATAGPGPGQVTISWPATMLTVGYSLQQAASLVSPINWQAGPAATQVGNNWQVTIASPGAPHYYRLIK